MQLVILILVVGFPIALAFSWAFEITPEGIKRESEVEADKSITRHTGRKIVALTVVLGVIAAGLLAFRLWGPKTSTPEQKNISSENAAPVPNKSIAVLPFDNLSRDPDNAYFAEGIQDEILTRLSKIGALKVISRSSTQKYKSAPENLREVGNQLGVANLLEGSVQKVANAVHINVQLIRAATDEHVWAESYNRKLDDVFGVEGEVASAIADQLKAKLTGAEEKALTDKPTQNAAAYDAYLRGLSIEHNEYSYDSDQRAGGAYGQAVQLDPKFGLAWARLAAIRSFLFFNNIDSSVNTATAVKEASDRAMQTAPEAGESWVAQGAYRYRVLRDFDGALVAYEEAQKRLPNSAFVYQYMAFVQRRVGRWQDAETSYKKALELDPRDIQLLSSISGEFYIYLRRFDDALALANRAVEIAPDSAPARANKVGVLQAAGRLKEAAEELAQIPANSNEDFVVGARALQGMYERHYDDTIKAVQQRNALPAAEQLGGFGRVVLVEAGYCYLWSGRAAEARNAFMRVISNLKPTLDAVVRPDANGSPMQLALAYAGIGEKEKALAQGQRATTDYATDAVNKPFAEITLAQVQLQFGEREAAIAALPHLLEVAAGVSVADLKYNPMWDPLRQDPRFQKLCEERPK